MFDLIRDREVLTQIVAEVAGDHVARANQHEKVKTLKTIVRDHLDGSNRRTKVEHWVPRWMAFPPSAYTGRGGVGTVTAAALVAAVRAGNDAPGPNGPDTVLALPAPEPACAEPMPQALAA